MKVEAIFSLVLSLSLFNGLTAASLAPHSGRNDNNAVKVYPIPQRIPTMNSYTIEVQPLGGQSQSVDSYLTMLSQANTTSGLQTVHNTSIAYFDFSGSVDVSITYNNGEIKTAAVRPFSYGIEPRVMGPNKLKFTLTEPRSVLVQVNDDIWDTLQLLTHPIETDVPDSSDPDVLYFAPGINNSPAYANVTNGTLSVPSGKTVYVAGGAVLTARVLFNRTSNGSVRGRGIIKAPEGAAVEINHSLDTTVKDIITFDGSLLAGSSDGITISGTRSFSSEGWGDGIDLYCSKNALIDNVFMRNSDDNIALYQHREEFYGDSSNITIQNAALWADYAHAINIGTHGNTDNPETMDGVVIKNVDIMDHNEPQMWYQGTISINPGDSNIIQNVHIEDIRVENFREGQLVNLKIMYNTKYNTSPGRGIRNVYIKDMVYSGTNANPSLLLGYDAESTIDNVTFVNLKVNGRVISDTMEKPSWYYTADFVPMFANEHVHNLSFTTA